MTFDEAVRWESPVQTFFRTATADVPITDGVEVPAGRKILMFLAAANRDPRRRAGALLTALARRVATIELAGPTRRHHNNTLRAWESLPVRLPEAAAPARS